MKTDLTFVDEIFRFAGAWDAPSECGLKIARHADRHVAVATELYDRNPGSSVASFAAELAAIVCRERGLDPRKLVFIEHCPDRGSKLDFYDETFDIVDLAFDGERFSDPRWRRVSRAEVEALIG